VTLSALRGRQVLLGFHRFAACPFCNLRVHRLVERHEEFTARGLEVVAVFESPLAAMREALARQEVPFAVIADPERSLYKRYGVDGGSVLGLLKAVTRGEDFLAARRLGLPLGSLDGKKTQLPADFLIGPDGRIRVAYLGRDIGDHLPIDELLRQLPS
jgi:peroxiredoxin